MIRLIVIALVAVATVGAWVWFRRRPVSDLPLALDRHPDEQSPPKDTHENQRTSVGMQAPITIDEHQQPSPEPPCEPTIERSDRDLTEIIAPTGSKSDEPAGVLADAAEVRVALPPSGAPGESPAAVANEPGRVLPIPVDHSCLSTNEANPHPQDETVRASEKDHVRSASPPIARRPSISASTTSAPSANTAPAGETAAKPSIADQESIEPHTPMEKASASLTTITPSSGREPEATTYGRSAPPPAKDEPLPKARSYSEPKPSPTTKTASKNERTPGLAPRTDASLQIRLQLVFGRDGSVRTLDLIPHRREGMPSSLEVATAGGSLQFSQSSADSYEPVPLSEVPNTLSEGVVWQTRSGAQRWRWELTRREIYVLAAGDAFGLRGFVTRRIDQRLWLNTRHVVLAKESLRDQVVGALAEAGCAPPEVCDSATPGVPTGWILFRNVTPTRAVPMRDERDILNVLCPAHEIEPQFVGGIRLERSDWLAGFPPRIRFAGQLGNDFQVLIDSQPAQLARDGAFESSGWDTEGEHRLWYCGRAETYSLRTMMEQWDTWPAYDFGTGAAICGARTCRIDGARGQRVCVPASNPLLIGARPGEIFRCRARNGLREGKIVALVPFTPVWALPIDRLPKENRSAILELVEFVEPLATHERRWQNLNATSAVRKWVFAIRNARRNQLELAVRNEAAEALWRRYGIVAAKLRRRMR